MPAANRPVWPAFLAAPRWSPAPKRPVESGVLRSTTKAATKRPIKKNETSVAPEPSFACRDDRKPEAPAQAVERRFQTWGGDRITVEHFHGQLPGLLLDMGCEERQQEQERVFKRLNGGVAAALQ